MSNHQANHAQQRHAFALYVRRAEANYQKGQYNKAIKRLERAAQLQPMRADVKRKLGVWLAEQKQLEAAVRHLKAALALTPNDIGTLVALARVHQDMQQVDLARHCLQKALAQAPNSPDALVGMGNLQHKQGQLKEAVSLYRKSLQARLTQPSQNTNIAPQHNFDARQAEPLLWQTLSQLAGAGIHAFACFGTLLGLTRQGQLLPHDHDIDIGLPYCELAAAGECLEDHGWIKVFIPGFINTLSYLHPPTNISVDLSGFVADASGNTFEGIWLDSLPSTAWRITCFPPLKLEKSTSPDGAPIWSLQEPRRWLKALYDDWETPDADFDTIVCAYNLCGMALLTQCYTYLRISNQWGIGQLSKALKLVGSARKHRPHDQLLEKIDIHLTQQCGP